MSRDERGFEAARFRQIERSGYNLIAARYASGATARAALHRAVLEAAACRPGERLLDVAAGPALLARAAAPSLAPGFAVATDIAEDLLAAGRQHGGTSTSVLFAAADAERLPFADAAFDLVVCGLGLMFFPDAAAAVGEMARVLKPGGRLVLSVWGEQADVPVVACALACLARVLPPPRVTRPSVFRFGAADAVPSLLAAAGLRAIHTAPQRLHSEFDDSVAYWQAFLDLAGGVAGSLARLPAGMRERLTAEVASDLAPYRSGPGYAMESVALVVRAEKSPV